MLAVVPPGRELRHNPQAPCAEEREVNDGITLFTETGKLTLAVYAKVSGDGIADPKEDRLTDKREKYDVVGKEDKIQPALAISRVRRVVCW